MATEYGCRVTGVDITPEEVELAADLAGRMGLTGHVDLSVPGTWLGVLT